MKRSFTVDKNIKVETIVAKYLNGVLKLNPAKKQQVIHPEKETSVQ